jgi:hypothetical protein
MKDKSSFFFYYSVALVAIILFILFFFNFHLFKHIPKQSDIKKFIIENESKKKILTIKKSFNNIYFDRIYKNNLAKYSSNDCFLLGSSQHVTLDVDLKVFSGCKKLTNLALQGATMEDYLITTYFIMENEKKPKKIFIGIEPPIFYLSYDPEKRWKIYENYFQNALELMQTNYDEIKKIDDVSRYLSFNFLKKNILNLIDGRNLFNNFEMIEKKDNSLPYFNHQGVLKNPNQDKIDHDLDMTGFRRDKYLEKLPLSRKIFNDLIIFLKENYFEIEFLILPYRKDVFENANWLENINETNSFLIDLKKQFNLKIKGTFYPNNNIKCDTNYFIDRSHPTLICINSVLNN